MKRASTFYTQPIRETLAKAGLVGRYHPIAIEAWMRLEHPTLDGLSAGAFRREVETAAQCIDAATPEETRSLAESFGLTVGAT